MPSVSISPPAKFSSELVTGLPLAGGKLYTYEAGTSTLYDTYTDSTGATANTNPVILDARGEANVWLEQGVAYKYVLKDSLDVLIWTVDQINSAPAGGFTQLFGNGTVSAPSISFLNSTGMGFYRISNNVMGLATAGALAVTFDASQNVGIGVTPTTKLDVNGTGKIRGALTVTTGGATITGNSSVTGTFGVTGATTLTGATTVAGGVFSTRGFVDNATAAAWNIDSSGRLLNNGDTQVQFAAERSGSTQTAGTTIIFNGESYDIGAGFNSTTGVFTAPVAGDYSFSATVETTNSSGANIGFQMRIVCSSAGSVASQSTVQPTASVWATNVHVSSVRLAAGETVSIVSNTALSATFYINNVTYSRFTGVLLG